MEEKYWYFPYLKVYGELFHELSDGDRSKILVAQYLYPTLKSYQKLTKRKNCRQRSDILKTTTAAGMLQA